MTDITLALGSIKKLMTSLIADSSNLVTLGNYIIKWRLNKSQTLLILLCFLSLFIGYFIYSFYFVVFHLLDEKLLLPCIFTFSTSIFFFFSFTISSSKVLKYYFFNKFLMNSTFICDF